MQAIANRGGDRSISYRLLQLALGWVHWRLARNAIPRQPLSSFLFRANLILLFCSAPTSFFFSVPRQPHSSFLFRANLFLLFCSAPISFFFSVLRQPLSSFLFRANLISLFCSAPISKLNLYSSFQSVRAVGAELNVCSLFQLRLALI